jgi:integrase/recombinase XerD
MYISYITYITKGVEEMNNAGEQLLSDVAKVIYDMFPYLDVEGTKSKLSTVVSKYHIKTVELNETHPDLHEKIQLYLSAKKLEGLSQSTLDGYELELNLFAAKVKKKVEDITSADIRVYLGSLQGIKISTLGAKLSKIKTFFNWLTSEELIKRDPAVKLKSPKVERGKPKALTGEEFEMLRESCKTTRQRAFIEVLYATGCRLSELHRLNINDINFQDMSNSVLGKGSKEREVYHSWKSLYHLRKYLNDRTDECEALFVTERKPYRRLTKRGIQREVKKIANVAGLEKKVSPHILRHTFATLTLNNGADLVAIQELLGHVSPDTTMRYARITEERKREQHKKYLVL